MQFPAPGCLAEWRANLPPMRERIVGALAAVTIISTLWNVSGMAAIPSIISVALAGTAFLSALIPLPFRDGSREIGQDNRRRLLRFPGFWVGVALTALMLCQHFNPSLEVFLPEKGWWHIGYFEDCVTWLPNGIVAPFGMDSRLGMNALRQICVFGSAWLVLCTLWCGLRSRRVRTWLVWVLVLNAVLLAVFCLLRWSNDLTKEYLGYKTGVGSFFGVFSYKNHAGEFFVESLALTVALALATWRRNAEKFKKSGSHVLLAVFALFLWIAGLCTASFAGIAESAAWLLIVPVLVLTSGLMRRATWIAAAFVSVMILGLAAVWFTTADMESTWKKVGTKFEMMKAEEIDDRAPLRDLTRQMIERSEMRTWLGWGAGSYRWIAPSFQAQMPEFLNKKGDLKTRTEYAHCDPLQMLAEWGRIGAGIFAAGTLCFVVFAVRNVRRWRGQTVALLCGILFFAAHSTMDFVSYNPALLQMLAVLAVGVKWSLKRLPSENVSRA